MAARSDENKRSPLKAWVRALERTAAIEREPSLTLPVLIGRLAERHGERASARRPTDTALTYREPRRRLPSLCTLGARARARSGATPCAC